MMHMTIDALRKRTVWRLTLAAMITSAILAPLVLGAFSLWIGSMNWAEGPPLPGITVALLAVAMLAMIPAACLGGLAMHRGARLRSEASTVGWGLIGGVLFLGAAACCCALLSFDFANIPDLESALVGMGILILMTIIGSIVSAPMGLAFGVLFLSALRPLLSRLEHPAVDTPATAMRFSSRMLLVASTVAFLCAATIQAPIATFMHDHLGMDSCWFGLVVFPSPLAFSAFAFALVDLLETRALYRTRTAILAGNHSEYTPGDIAPDADAVPLTEADRKSANKRLLQRRDASAYRGGATQKATVYVGS